MLRKVSITLTIIAFILGQWGFTLLFDDRIIKWKKEKDFEALAVGAAKSRE